MTFICYVPESDRHETGRATAGALRGAPRCVTLYVGGPSYHPKNGYGNESLAHGITCRLVYGDRGRRSYQLVGEPT
jgi:hypothetical protein